MDDFSNLSYFCFRMNDNFTNEFFGIGIQNGKTPENLGVLWRTAQNLGASFIFTIGNRYAKQSCDTHNAVKSMPYFHYETVSFPKLELLSFLKSL